jgi:hypothetical protein
MSCSQPQPTFTSNHDWTEPADPVQTDPALWDGVSKSVASWGSIDVRYPLSEPFSGDVATEQTLAGWRGEMVHGQLVVSTPVEIRDLTCEVGDFKGENGEVISDAGRGRFVKYVLSDFFTPEKPCGPRQSGEPARLMPDLLDEAPSLIAAAGTTRPVWITVDIPADAPAGKYSAEVKLKGKGFSETLTLNLDVIGRTLPRPRNGLTTSTCGNTLRRLLAWKELLCGATSTSRRCVP